LDSNFGLFPFHVVTQLIVEAGLLVFLSVLTIYSIFTTAAMVLGVPFVPSRKKAINNILQLAQIKPGEKTVDLGSGDGRIVVTLAQKGAVVTGYEINPVLVIISRIIIRRSGLSKLAHVYFQNFWNKNLSGFELVTIYGLPKIMDRLETKLDNELKPGARVISNTFIFPNWKYKKRVGNTYLYEKSL
jgi:hypothetical protein